VSINVWTGIIYILAHSLQTIPRRVLFKNTLHETMSHQLKYTKSYMSFNTKSYYNTRGPKFNKVFTYTFSKLFKSFAFGFYILTLKQ
jgi:hypothetical protein